MQTKRSLSEDKTNDGINQSDMYQLYAYGTKYQQCNTMFLIYPKDKDIDVSCYDYFNQTDKNLNLQILFFDVTCKEQEKNFIEKVQSTITQT
jgi:5-methylcytosine-specific restriction enzyme subunit McrC